MGSFVNFVRVSASVLAALTLALTALDACKEDDCTFTATCAEPRTPDAAIADTGSSNGSLPDDASVDADADLPPPPPLSVRLTGPVARVTAIQGSQASVDIQITRGAGVGQFTIQANNPPKGITVPPVLVPSDASTISVSVKVDASIAQGPLDVTVSAVFDDSGASHGDGTARLFVRGPAGSLDTTFGYVIGTGADIPQAALVSTGDIEAVVDDKLVRFLPNGAVDTLFANGGAPTIPGGIALVLDSADKSYVLGKGALARMSADGKYDPGFGTGGVLALSSSVTPTGLALDPNGKLQLAGYCPLCSPKYGQLTRFSLVGGIDTSFNSPTGGKTFRSASDSPSYGFGGDVVVGTDGTAYAAYTSGAGAGLLTSVTPDGLQLKTVALATSNDGTAVVARSSVGAIYIATSNAALLAPHEMHVARYSSSLVSDPLFGSGLVTAAVAVVSSVRELANGTVLVAGYLPPNGTMHGKAVVERFLSNGSPDPSYGTQGIATIDANGAGVTGDVDLNAVLIQSDGSAIAVGHTGSKSVLFRLWP
jgi:uncharacterized delta-60 repeat protein